MLRENLRTNSHRTDPAQVREAYYEPSGNVSVIPKKEEGKPHVVEVDVEEGVETIRIALNTQSEQ
jgi:uncharacterized membrane protein YcaP (DUF421 family)